MRQVFLSYLSTKTRIIIHNKVELLKYFDQVIFMKGGKIEGVGKYN